MQDHLSSAAKHIESVADAERRAVCDDCHKAQADLLAEIGQAPADAETAEATEMTAWLAKHVPHLEPQALALAAAVALQTDERQFTPDFKLTGEDPADIAPDIELLMADLAVRQRNATTTGQIDDGVPAKVPTEVGAESRLLTTEAELTDDRSALEIQRVQLSETEVAERETDQLEKTKTAELRRLQATFNELLADGVDTTTALHTVIGQAEHLETRRQLHTLLHRITALTVALPGKAAVIQAALRTAPLDLAAPTIAASFAGFLTAAETNPEFTEADRATIRRVIKQTEHDVHTGTKVYEAALSTTIDPVTGESIPLHTSENKAEVLPGVHAFTETGHNVLLEMKTPRRRMTIDVTGYDGATIGLIAEAMGFQAHLEELKATAFVREVYGVDFGLLGDPSFDPLSLLSLRQRLTYLVGDSEGYDGDIFDPSSKSTLIVTQMRLTSPTNSAYGWENDPAGAQARITQLGLHNIPVLEEFGRYTQLNHSLGKITSDAIQQHLQQKFPDLVKSRAGPDEPKRPTS